MTGRQKKITKRLAWLLTLHALDSRLPQPLQAATSSQADQVVMEASVSAVQAWS